MRGRGLLIGVDLVNDRRSKEPLAKAVTRQIFLEALRRGLVSMGYKAHFRINPPLVLSRDEADDGLAILDEVFAHVVDHIPYR